MFCFVCLNYCVGGVYLWIRGLLHKPNYGALVDQLTALSGAFKREGNYHFAALCHLSVARCEHILKNTTLEASAFVDAGHAFWGAATEAHEAALLSFDENVTEAINCYTLAIEVHHIKQWWLKLTIIQIYIAAQQKSMAATLYYEIAVLLKVQLLMQTCCFTLCRNLASTAKLAHTSSEQQSCKLLKSFFQH